jgi:hypothetical protein
LLELIFVRAALDALALLVGQLEPASTQNAQQELRSSEPCSLGSSLREQLLGDRYGTPASVGPQRPGLAEETDGHQSTRLAVVLEQKLGADLQALEFWSEPQVRQKVVEGIVDERRRLPPNPLSNPAPGLIRATGI